MYSRKSPALNNTGGIPISRLSGLAILLLSVTLLAFGLGCETPDMGDVAPSATVRATDPDDGHVSPPDVSTPLGQPERQTTTDAPARTSQPSLLPDRNSRTRDGNERLPSSPMTAADFPVPPNRDLRLLAEQMRWHGVVPTDTPFLEVNKREWQVGDTRDFWTLDYPRNQMVSQRFRLASVSDNAYWWAHAEEKVDDEELARTVDNAEAQVFPRVQSVFASGAEPERVHIINGRIPGVGGYVSGSDQYPASVAPYSNEAPAIYINTRAAAYGDDRFLSILAHELQHVIHQVADESEATWLNEGLSELAATEAGYRAGSIYQYLRSPKASIVNWPATLSANVGLNYGAAALFVHYLREHYAPNGGLQDLLAIQADGIAAVNQWLSQRGATTVTGESAGFRAVFADWLVANFLDRNEGRHGYGNLEVEASITRTQDADEPAPDATLAQYGVDYVDVGNAHQVDAVHFQGSAITRLLPTDVAGQCWWSNRGDTKSATLTRDLMVPTQKPGEADPALTYRYWHDIEEDWDYLYVSASTDGGGTWDVLEATGTTDTNPMGNSYGYGYTGTSDGWQDGEASLAAYAGLQTSIRFHYVTDDAINGPGMCVQNMQIDGDPDGNDPDAWTADGFVLVNNRVRQDWIVWVMVDGDEKSATRVELAWDEAGDRYTGNIPIDKNSNGRLVVAVAATAPATMQPGHYKVWAETSQ